MSQNNSVSESINPVMSSTAVVSPTSRTIDPLTSTTVSPTTIPTLSTAFNASSRTLSRHPLSAFKPPGPNYRRQEVEQPVEKSTNKRKNASHLDQSQILNHSRRTNTDSSLNVSTTSTDPTTLRSTGAVPKRRVPFTAESSSEPTTKTSSKRKRRDQLDESQIINHSRRIRPASSTSSSV